jgi:predicted transposase/invertase (TIGR01784 family)
MEQERYINPYTDFGFKKLFDQAEIAQYSPEERREYEASIKNYWDYYSTMKTAVKKGREEGRAEGRAEERRENAHKMKEDNMPTALIAKYTGLTEEEIEKL